MTIAVGFCCQEGIVLCADTEETVGAILKRSEPKILIRPEGNDLEHGEVHETRAVFACAGDGSFIDMTIEKIWRRMRGANPDQAGVVEALEDELIRIHQQYWPLYADQDRPKLEMLIAIYTQRHFLRSGKQMARF